MVYALRLNGRRWDPPVFGPGSYRITVEKGEERRVIRGLSPLQRRGAERLPLDFSAEGK
jgi:hypothetical protein